MANAGLPATRGRWMHDGRYGLGIDVGDRAVRAVVVRAGGSPEPLALPPDVLPDLDGLLPRHLMARVGVPTPLFVRDRPVPAARLVADVVAAVKAVATDREGAPPVRTVLVVPPSWGAHRRDELAAALAPGAAFLVPGPVAVVHHLLAGGELAPAPLVAVADLGASTLDTAVVRTDGPGGPELVVVPATALPWGGRDVDDVLVALLPRLAAAPSADDAALAAELRRRCTAAKEGLSTDTSVLVEVPGAEGGTQVRLVREDLEEALAGPLRTAVEALRSSVAEAGATVEDLDAVLLTGGGAHLPLVAEELSAALGRPLTVPGDPVLAAASGAAALALDRAAEQLRADRAAAADDALPAGEVPPRRRTPGVPGPRRPRPPAGSSGPGREDAGRRRHQRWAVVVGALLLALVTPAVLNLPGLSSRDRSAAGSGSAPVAGAVAPAGEEQTPVGGSTTTSGSRPGSSRRSGQPATEVLAARATTARTAAGTTTGSATTPGRSSTPAGTAAGASPATTRPLQQGVGAQVPPATTAATAATAATAVPAPPAGTEDPTPAATTTEPSPPAPTSDQEPPATTTSPPSTPDPPESSGTGTPPAETSTDPVPPADAPSPTAGAGA